MDSPTCRLLGIKFPLLGFSHCRDVVAAVSRGGGFGVFGAAGCTPDQLEIELAWIDAHVDGKPYGVDLLVPENLSIRTAAGATLGDLAGQFQPGTGRSCTICCGGMMSTRRRGSMRGRIPRVRCRTSSRPVSG